MVVKILETGCQKCKTLEDKVKEIAQKNDIKLQLQKVTELDKIMDYGIMMTPGLVINDQVKSVGATPGEEQILTWLKEAQNNLGTKTVKTQPVSTVKIKFIELGSRSK